MKHLSVRPFAVLIAAVTIAAAPAAADDSSELRKLFPHEADLSADGSGLARLELGAKILELCRPDLSDVRIFDDQGRETAYVVDSRRATDRDLEVVQRVRATVTGVTRHEDRPETAPARFTETYTLEVPFLPRGAAAWDLVLASGRKEFVRRIDITAVRSNGARSSVVDGGSTFRLPTPPADRMRFPIGVHADLLEVRLIGENANYLKPNFFFEARRRLPGRMPGAARLEVVEVQRSADHTVVVLDRPRGLVPDRLRLTTTTGAFHREVSVWDDGPGASDSPLARKALFRIDAFVPVEELELELASARGDRLRVVIIDRDSPPLEQIAFEAVIARPVLYFSMPEGESTAVLRFGGARAHRPDYDLAALRPPASLPVQGEAAERALAFWDQGSAHPVAVSEIRSNPFYDPQPALAFAMRAGAVLTTKPFAYRRVLQVNPSDEGLSRLRITPEDLAVLRGDLADLRVVDESGRQWAYLVEREATTADLILGIEKQRSADRETTYSIAMPYEFLSLGRLDLNPAEPFFDRPYTLRGTRPDGTEISLATGRLARHRGDPRPVVLTFSKSRLLELELVISDGDDAPLELAFVTARVPQPDLFLAAPAGLYSLLLGHPATEPPSYELERVRATVLAVPANDVGTGILEENPEYRAASRFTTSTGAQQLVLWMVLGIAVLALAGLTFKLARQEKSDS